MGIEEQRKDPSLELMDHGQAVMGKLRLVRAWSGPTMAGGFLGRIRVSWYCVVNFTSASIRAAARTQKPICVQVISAHGTVMLI